MWKPLIIGTILATIIIFFLNSMMNSAMAETNTVSSTVVTNSTPPTANSPSDTRYTQGYNMMSTRCLVNKKDDKTF